MRGGGAQVRSAPASMPGPLGPPGSCPCWAQASRGHGPSLPPPDAAITSGPIRDRKGYCLGRSANPKVTGALFETFLGLNSIDPLGKRLVGGGLLWCANGFRCEGSCCTGT